MRLWLAIIVLLIPALSWAGSARRFQGTHQIPALGSAIMSLSASPITATGAASVTLPSASMTLAANAVTASVYVQQYQTDSFEANNDGWSSSNWNRVASTPHAGSWSFYNWSQATAATKTITTSAGNITFWYWMSPGCSGYFEVTLNPSSTTHDNMTVTSSWQQVTIPVTAGSHTLTLHGTGSNVFVDEIKIPIP